MNILLAQTAFFGDVILSTPVIGNLRRFYPAARITILTTPRAEPLVKYHPLVAETIVYDKRGSQSGLREFWQLSRLLRAKRFDKVFSLHKSLRTAALLRLAGIPERYGFSESAGAFLYTKVCPSQDIKEHAVLRNLAIFRNLGLLPEDLSGLDTAPHIGLPPDALSAADRILKDESGRPVVGIAPGSVWAMKRWTAEGYAMIAVELAKEGYRIAILGGREDASSADLICSRLEEKVPGVKPINLAGKLGIIVSAAVVSRLRMLLTNDSAPLHMASAFRIPTVAVFCATVPEFGFGPWHTVSECVGVPNLACRPCHRHGPNVCPTGTQACQLQLTPAAVMAAAQRVLERSREAFEVL